MIGTIINKLNANKKNKYEDCMSSSDPVLLSKWYEEQNLLKTKLIEKDDFNCNVNGIKLIGGMDISASVSNPNVAIVALIICNTENFEVIYEKYEFVEMTQPYIPGYLAFREIEHLLKLINELKQIKPELLPQVILVDGNGILHSNRFGLACHLGVLSDIPTIGCGKTVFSVDGINKFKVKQESKTLQNAGDFILLQGNSGAIWGAALKCTQVSVDPLIVTVGHKTSLETAIEIVKKCCKFRVPEPIRIADKLSRALINEYEKTKLLYVSQENLSKLKKNLYDID